MVPAGMHEEAQCVLLFFVSLLLASRSMQGRQGFAVAACKSDFNPTLGS